MRTALLLSASLLAVVLAGCTSEPAKTVVDFSQVTETQEGAEEGGYRLTVRVMGLEGTSPVPLSGAFVGAAIGDDVAIAKGYTGGDGRLTFTLLRDQEVRLVARATGWTTEESRKLALGASGGDGGSGCGATGSAGPGGAEGSVEASDCLAMEAFAAEPAIPMPGDEGTVSLVIFRESLAQNLTIPVSPRAANHRSEEGAGGKAWVPLAITVAEDPAIESVYLSRLKEVRGTLSWTNNLVSQADFELAYGCNGDTPSLQTDGGTLHSYLSQQGTVRVELAWADPVAGWEGECTRLHAGPLVDAASTQVTPALDLTLLFQGKSRIIPVDG